MPQPAKKCSVYKVSENRCFFGQRFFGSDKTFRGKYMGKYTDSLEEKSYVISTDDDDYIDELEKAAAGFRCFDEALDAFLLEHGYGGETADTDGKINYIKQKYKAEKIDIPRNIKKWYSEHKSFERGTAFSLCFAFGLNLEETEDFFRRVMLQRCFDCHSMEELIYCYCIHRGYSYQRAQELIQNAPKVKADKMSFGGDLLYTFVIEDEVKGFRNDSELLDFLDKNKEQFGYNNVSAVMLIRKLWNGISEEGESDEGGLARRERKSLYDAADTEDRAADGTKASLWSVYKQILGLYGDKFSQIDAARTIKPMLRDSRLLNPLAEKAFPDRDGLNKILNGEHISDERVRKMMILLLFYEYWVKLALKRQTYKAEYSDSGRCLAYINGHMADIGYPVLYYGNPYDWIFLFASKDDYPLVTFREIMREIFWRYKALNP